jgi:hypothetical protein
MKEEEMTPAILIAISLMWMAVGIMFIGKGGEAKSTGFISGLVGTVTVFGAFYQAANNDVLTAGLLFAHGMLYLVVSFALLAGLSDLRTVGNVSLAVCLISLIYTIIFLVVTPAAYLALACAGYTVLTLMVFLNAYGKLSAPIVGWSLITWVFVGLWAPAFSLLISGAFPF